LKPNKSRKLKFRYVDSYFHSLLFKAKSLNIFHDFKFCFIVSSHVNFGLHIPLLPLLSHLRILLSTSALEVSIEYVQTISTGVG
jgi:hypothetical protein